MRGRKPSSDRLKLFAGDGPLQGRMPIGGREPPSCPDWLDAEARVEWNRIVALLGEYAIITQADQQPLAFYCQICSDFQQAVKAVREHGQYFDSPNGPRLHPAARLITSLSAEMRRYADIFGLSPQARTRIDVPAPASEEEDDFAELERS